MQSAILFTSPTMALRTLGFQAFLEAVIKYKVLNPLKLLIRENFIYRLLTAPVE